MLTTQQLTLEKHIKTTTYKDLVQFMRRNFTFRTGRSRITFLDPERKVVYKLHKSILRDAEGKHLRQFRFNQRESLNYKNYLKGKINQRSGLYNRRVSLIVPIADLKLIYTADKEPVIIMELLDQVSDGYEDVSYDAEILTENDNWLDYIYDGLQVGLNSAGKLVAFDHTFPL